MDIQNPRQAGEQAVSWVCQDQLAGLRENPVAVQDASYKSPGLLHWAQAWIYQALGGRGFN